MSDFIQSMTGCTREEADAAVQTYGDDLWLAIESLLPKSSATGNKYIPEKPRVDTGLSAEQQEICRKGRELQDKVNAVFSVAHSKTQTQPAQPDAVAQSSPTSAAAVIAGSSSESLELDVHAKTSQ